MATIILLKDWLASQIEFWSPVRNHEGYEVSSAGRVRSLWQQINVDGKTRYILGTSPRILKSTKATCGYMQNLLKTKRWLVHRLVATTFIENVSGARTVNHRNGIKSDNRLDNLEWASYKENIGHAIRIGLRKQNGEGNGRALVTETDVREIRELYSNGHTQLALARRYGVKAVTIQAITSRRNWKHIE